MTYKITDPDALRGIALAFAIMGCDPAKLIKQADELELQQNEAGGK